MSSDDVALSHQEECVFGVLREAVGGCSDVVLRVAGGWVRDKLLGKESKDIDVVVEGMESEVFVRLVSSVVERQGGAPPKVAVMEADPEHGKHLQACNMVLEGVSVDFVTLRQGGALVDAQHRDLTINSLFYNVNQRKVEDATGLGLSDLRHGLLRAPVADPMFTLRHDPLRAVRVARFAATTGYAVDRSLLAAMAEPALRLQLLASTKRDRIGQELKKAFAPGARAAVAIALLAETGLFDVVMLGRLEETYAAHAAARRVANVDSLCGGDAADGGRVGLVLAACLWDIDCGMDLTATRFKDAELYQAVVVSLRLSHQDGEAAVIIAKGARRLRGMPTNATRLQLGLWMRACGALWTLAWTLAVAADAEMERFEALKGVRHAVADMQLDGVWRMKPLLNGNQISQLLHISPGPIFATLTEKLIEEQLKRPSMTYTEAEQFLLNLKLP